MQVLWLADVKKPLLSQKNIRQNEVIGRIWKYGYGVLWSDESIFQLHADLQRGVFKDLVRNTIVNASLPQLSMAEEVSWYGEPFQLLVLVSYFLFYLEEIRYSKDLGTVHRP